MATTVKGRKPANDTPAQQDAPLLDNKVEKDAPKHTDFAAELQLRKPFDGIEVLRFRRIKLVDLRNIFSHERPETQLGRFIQDKAEPALSREQISEQLDGWDASSIQEVMNWLMGGYADDEDEETERSIWDDETRPTRGDWNEGESLLTLGFPLYTQNARTGEMLAIKQFKFRDSVPFGKSGTLRQDDISPNGWVRGVQDFLRIYGQVIVQDSDMVIPMTSSLTDQLDATDVLQILMEVQPSVLGKQDKRTRFKPL